MITAILYHLNQSLDNDKGNVCLDDDDHVGMLFYETWKTSHWIGSKKSTTIYLLNWMHVGNTKEKRYLQTKLWFKKNGSNCDFVVHTGSRRHCTYGY